MSAIRWTDPRDGVEVELVNSTECRDCKYLHETLCPHHRADPREAGPRCARGVWRPVAAPAAAPDSYRINADRTAAVAVDTTWRSDMDRCPRGVRVLLLVRDGLPVIGEYRGEPHFEAWHPMPRRGADEGGAQ